MTTAPLPFRPRSVAVLGRGRVGPVFARALARAGFVVHGPTGRGEPVGPADIALVCVPDREIPDAAATARGRARLVGHTSGATPLDDVDFGLHPLQTFTGDESPEVLHGVGAAIGGRSPEAIATARALADALGMRPFELADEHRAAYHAAATIASNYLVVLEAAAERLAGIALPGEPVRELLAPLVHRTVENWVARGAEGALTGPIARGDDGTVARQRAAVAAAAPALLDLFDMLATHARALAAGESS